MAQSLVDRTYRLLRQSDLTYREIADQADIGYEWLKSFATGRRRNPGVERIERLHNFLAAHRRTRRLPNRSQQMGRVGNG